MKVRKLQQKRGWAWSIAVPIVKPVLLATTTRTTGSAGRSIPETGGFILVLNHVSHVDPLTAAHIVYDHGRLPRYLAKSGLFKNKALGYFLTRRRPDPGRAAEHERRRRVRRRRRAPCATASASWSTPRARSPATPACGR